MLYTMSTPKIDLPNERIITLGEAIREALVEAMARDESVFLISQGVADPSAMWGTQKGIGDKFGAERVVEMPVAENGSIGTAIGAAMSGQRPVVGLHRVEFALPAFEQIVNNAAKIHYISNGQHKVPLVIRMVVGRGWGQGPEHSQSLEAVFAHFPGLKVVMPTFAADAKGMLTAAIEDDNPVIFIEHRWLHDSSGHVPEGHHVEPLDGPRVVRQGSELSIVATSQSTLEAMRAAEAMEEIGHSIEVVDMRVLRPLQLASIYESVGKTGRILTVDTGLIHYGVGGEVVASVSSDCFANLSAPPVRLGLVDHPTPSSRGMVPGFYPDTEMIVRAAGDMLGTDPAKVESLLSTLNAGKDQLPIDVPNPFFKGPF
jgi:pyruvate dehydrogenase E1 component beta subunit